jgi:Holliday junction resolvase RusA-like endonuclease
MIQFTVIGKPVTKGSTSSFVAKHKDGSIVVRENGNPAVVTRNAAGARGRVWEHAVASCALEAREKAGGRIAPNQPVGVEVIFYQSRNSGHFGTGRNAHLLKASAPTYPAVRPDVDKYLRAILDALTGVLYADDGQVVSVRAEKRYGDPPRAEIRVWVVSACAEDGQLELAAQSPSDQLALTG